MAKNKTYSWAPPIAFRGDRVRMSNFGKSIHDGEVVSVETHYDHAGRSYHVYGVLPDGWKVRRYVGADNIISHI